MHSDILNLHKNILWKSNGGFLRKEQETLDFFRGVFLIKNLIDIKDHYTYMHCINVSKYVNLIGVQLGLPERELNCLTLAGLLHDIGKARIPLDLLLKKGRLTCREFNIIKLHVKYGAEIVNRYKYFQELNLPIYHHHERYDGKGYPQGLKGKEIPLMSRIINVADSFDAMTTDRPYKKGLELNEAINELEINSGAQFDDVIVTAFLKVIKT